MTIYLRNLLVALFVAVLPLPALGAGLSDVVLLAVSSERGRAVIRVADGELCVLAEGDEVPRTGHRLTRVLTDRVEVEEAPAEPTAAPCRAWVFLDGAGPDGRRVVRLEISVEAGPSRSPARDPIVDGGAGSDSDGTEVRSALDLDRTVPEPDTDTSRDSQTAGASESADAAGDGDGE